MSLNEHLFTEEERALLEEAGDFAYSHFYWQPPQPETFRKKFWGDRTRKLCDILKKAQGKPFYYIHRRGDVVDIFLKAKETKLIKTIPCPLKEESTEHVLESVGITHQRYLEPVDFMRLCLIGYQLNTDDSLIDLTYTPDLLYKSFSSLLCDSPHVGKRNLLEKEEDEIYGDVEMQTIKIIKLTAINGSVVTIPADMFADYLFTNPPLHKLLTQLIDKARNGKEVILSLDEYMTPRKLKDKRTAREQMKRLFDVLYEMSFGVRNEGFRDFRIIYDREYKDRIGERVVFTDPFLEHINDSKDGYLLNVPADFMPIENPTAYWIAVYANLHRLRRSKTFGGRNSLHAVIKLHVSRFLELL